MKIRMGFVSNSSSSSFMIYGTIVTKDDFVNNLENLKKRAIDLLPKSDSKYDIELLKDWESIPDNLNEVDKYGIIKDLDDLFETLSVLFRTTDIEIHNGSDYGDEVYVGLCPSMIRDDETGREFKDRVERQINELFPNEKTFSYMDEC